MSDQKLVLVLSEEEFPDKETPKIISSLVTGCDIEILWDKGNIRSHKKLVPVLEKYPDHPVLILDDDKMYPKGLINHFINSHNKYPDDVIIGGSFFGLYPENGNIKCELLSGVPELINKLVPDEEITIQKPASGCFGMLFPAHTFTDPRFFDRDLFMRLVPNCDESWYYLFCVLENRRMRALEHIYEIIPNIIMTQEHALKNSNGKEVYTQYYNNILKEFPEFYDKLVHKYEQYKLTH